VRGPSPPVPPARALLCLSRQDCRRPAAARKPRAAFGRPASRVVASPPCVAPVVCRASQIEPARWRAGEGKDPMNSINLIGRLTREPDSRTTPNGTPVVTMRVAIDRPGDGADYVNVTAFG